MSTSSKKPDDSSPEPADGGGTGAADQHLVTQLLEQASGGDSHAAAELLPLVYDELRRLARSKMAAEAGGGAGHTLQPTALVHEAYMRLLGTAGKEIKWDGRAHFFGAAARAMRRILIERARSRNRLKRGGGRDGVRVELDEAAISDESRSEELLALDEILDKLERHDKRKADVVMMRYFAGLSIDETAAALGVSPATVKNDWTFARAWLNHELSKERPDRKED
jgi:RNA polymerase sigma factor (TIGR02999 family)